MHHASPLIFCPVLSCLFIFLPSTGAGASPLQCVPLADSCLALGAASCRRAIEMIPLLVAPYQSSEDAQAAGLLPPVAADAISTANTTSTATGVVAPGRGVGDGGSGGGIGSDGSGDGVARQLAPAGPGVHGQGGVGMHDNDDDMHDHDDDDADVILIHAKTTLGAGASSAKPTSAVSLRFHSHGGTLPSTASSTGLGTASIGTAVGDVACPPVVAVPAGPGRVFVGPGGLLGRAAEGARVIYSATDSVFVHFPKAAPEQAVRLGTKVRGKQH